MLHFKNSYERTIYEKMMTKYDKRFNSDLSSLSVWRGEYGYHSTLKNQIVHPIRDTFTYAVELLNFDRDGDRQKALNILGNLIKYQDIDPSSKTYGIWPYYMEESLSEMSPPDWNWADFCGKEILQVLLEHDHKLTNELRSSLKSSLLHACYSIKRRNMHPGYTNISVMGTYVTLVSAELLDDTELFEYASERLKVLYDYNMEKMAFSEYNSPTYSVILASDLARMLHYIKSTQALELISELNSLAWETIAKHFHYKTKQWAGPHARAYSMIQNIGLLMYIQRALNYSIDLVDISDENSFEHVSLDFFSTNISCPIEFAHYFTQPGEEIEIKQATNDNAVATTYMTENYALGNFYQSTFWNQRRNMLCYYGVEGQVRYGVVRLLHDFYDYTSASIVTAQDKNRAISLVNFSTDGGDTHPNLDLIKDATISAVDMRIRFEFGGYIEMLSIEKSNKNTFVLQDGDIKIKIILPYVQFGSFQSRFEIVEIFDYISETGSHQTQGNIKALDVVLYQGERRELCFTDFDECVCALSYEVTDGEFSNDEIIVEKWNDSLLISQGSLKVQSMLKATDTRTIEAKTFAYINNNEYKKLYSLDI